MITPVYRDGTVHVLSERCSTCIFRGGNLMQLQPGRVGSMVAEATANDSVIPCHQTIYRADVDPAVCRGYFDAYADRVAGLRAAKAFDLITEDPTPTKEDT